MTRPYVETLERALRPFAEAAQWPGFRLDDIKREHLSAAAKALGLPDWNTVAGRAAIVSSTESKKP